MTEHVVHLAVGPLYCYAESVLLRGLSLGKDVCIGSLPVGNVPQLGLPSRRLPCKLLLIMLPPLLIICRGLSHEGAHRIVLILSQYSFRFCPSGREDALGALCY